MKLRFLLLPFVLFLFASVASLAQPDPDVVDTVEVDTTGFPIIEDDTTGYSDVDFGDAGEPSPRGLPASAGAYGGPTFEFTRLDPATLDPELTDGNLIFFGGQGYVILGGWIVGGGGYGATLYSTVADRRYDEFAFGWGGFLTGYDKLLFSSFSVRATVLIGGGELKMIKKQPDLGDPIANDRMNDYTRQRGTEILERFRQEDFFLLRPGFSIGFAPIPFMDIRVSADYMMPFGGDKVDDLKTLTYGLHLMFGFGR